MVGIQQSLAADAHRTQTLDAEKIRSCAWTLTQLLSLAIADDFPMHKIAPWRIGQPVTAGLVAQWMRREFTGLASHTPVHGKSRKFRRPEARHAR